MPLRNWEDGQELVIADLNAISKALLRELYDRLGYEIVQRTENAFFSDSLKVSYSSANTVIVKAGLGFQTDNTQVSPEPTKRMVYLSADAAKIISTPNGTNPRIDLVCVKATQLTELTGSRKVKDAASSVISTQTLTIQKDWQAEIILVDGTPAASPVAPSVPAGYLAIGQLYVTAITGLAGAGAITDLRSLMPLGSNLKIDTSAAQRVTAGSAVTISTLIANIDALLKNGYQNYTDFDDLVADPASPGASKVRFYVKNGLVYKKNSAGTVAPVGSGGGGGGGGANWQVVSGSAPIDSFEYDERVWLFEQGQSQALTLWVKVPSSYLAGTKISLLGLFYSPSAINNWKMQAAATLVRKGTDAITTTTNVNTLNSGDKTNTLANKLTEISIDLSSAFGAINSVSVSAGDIIKIQLSRIATTGTDDTADLRFIPSSTEVLFS